MSGPFYPHEWVFSRTASESVQPFLHSSRTLCPTYSTVGYASPHPNAISEGRDITSQRKKAHNYRCYGTVRLDMNNNDLTLPAILLLVVKKGYRSYATGNEKKNAEWLCHYARAERERERGTVLHGSHSAHIRSFVITVFLSRRVSWRYGTRCQRHHKQLGCSIQHDLTIIIAVELADKAIERSQWTQRAHISVRRYCSHTTSC